MQSQQKYYIQQGKIEEEFNDYCKSNKEVLAKSRSRATSIKYNRNFGKPKKRYFCKLIIRKHSQKTVLKSLKQFSPILNFHQRQNSYEEGLDEDIYIDRLALNEEVQINKFQQIISQQKNNRRNQLQQNQSLIYKSYRRIINGGSDNTITDLAIQRFQKKQEEKSDYDKMVGFPNINEEFKQMYQRNPHEDNYNIILMNSCGFQAIFDNYNHYSDRFPFLGARKFFVVVFEIFSLLCENILNCKLYPYLMLLITITNIVLVVIKYYDNLYSLHSTFFDTQSQSKKTSRLLVFVMIYSVEICIRLIGKNLLNFVSEFWNMFDLFNLVLLEIITTKYISFDFSPLRAIRVLIFISQMSSQLQLTFQALIKSFRFMVEALLIVIIFSIFFANIGLHQFKNLTQNKCVLLQDGFIILDSYCGWLDCAESMICVNIPLNLSEDPITNFNNFVNSFISIIRIITMDNWTDLMYPILYSLNPFAWLYFVFVIFIVGFFAFNLIIAILKTQYSHIVSNPSLIQIRSSDKVNNSHKLNLRFIKNAGLYGKLKSLQKAKLTSMKLEAQENSAILNNDTSLTKYPLLKFGLNASVCNPQPSDQKSIAQAVVKKLRNLVKKQHESNERQYQEWHFLSARQRREILNISKTNQLNLNQNMKQCKFRNLVLPKRFLILEQTFYENFDLQVEQETIEILHNQDLLGWKTQIKYSHYQSSSQSEVFGYKQEKILKEKLLESELLLIKASKLRQIYAFSLSSLNELDAQYNLTSRSNATTKRLPVKQSKRKYSIQSSTFEELRNDQMIIKKSPKQMNQSMKKSKFCKGKSFSMKQQISDCFFEFPEYQVGQSYFILNGIKWNYDSISILINRELIQDQIDSDYDDTNLQLQKYLQFRQKELRKGYISSCNQSLQDVTTKIELAKILSILKEQNSVEIKIWLAGFFGFVQYSQILVKKFIIKDIVNLFFDFSTLINFCTLCSVGFIEDQIIDYISFCMTFILITQILLRIIGQGIIGFSYKSNNILDVFIIIVAIIYDSLERSNIYIQKDYSSEFKVLRAVNSILLYRIVKYNQFLTRIMKIANKTFKKYLSLTFLMFSVILIFAILGMQFFVSNFKESDSLSQLHSFKSFAKSWMTVFNIITNDDAIGMLKVTIRHQQTWIGIIFYISIVFTINYLIYGLVIAVLLDAFSSELEQVAEIKKDQSISLMKKLGIDEDISLDEETDSIFIDTNDYITQEEFTLCSKSQTPQSSRIFLRELPETSKRLFMQKRKPKFLYFVDTKCRKTCFFFSYNNTFRKWCYRQSKTLCFKFVNNFTLSSTIAVLVTLSFQTEDFDIQQFHFSNPKFSYCLLGQNIIILTCYLVEIISNGFILTEGGAFRDFWKLIDLTYILSFFFSYFIHIRLLTLLLYLIFCRPLMMVNMFESVQGVKNAMIQSLFQVINIITVILLVFMVFNVFAMHLYHNKMGYCEDLMDFNVNKQECESQQKQWINHPYNFDNFINGLFTLTMITSLDAWGEVMQVCYNANYPDEGPSPFNIQWATYALFIAFIFIGAMFFMGFLTGVLFTEFQKFTKQLENKYLTPEQSQFIQICSSILTQTPNYSHAPHSALRKLAYNIAFNKYYKYCYYYVLVSNGIILCFLFDISTEYTRNLANQAYQLFTILFTFDCLIKILAFGIVRFLATTWRVIELLLTLLSIVDLFADFRMRWFQHYSENSSDITIIYLARIFMISRDLKILLIFQEFKGLQRLLRVLYFSSPLLLKILYVQMVIQTTYALIGSKLFNNITMGRVMDDNYINFKNFLNSALILFKCTTGDDWRAVIIDCSQSNMYCYSDPSQCGSNWSYLFFLSYYLLSNIMVMNLFVLALVDQFENFFNNTTNVIQTFVENIDHFCNCWCRYTYLTKGQKMHTRYIGRFLLDLSSPLGAQEGDNIWDAAKDAFNFRIRADTQGFVKFNDLLYETIRFAFVNKVFKEGSETGKIQMKLFDIAMKQKLQEEVNAKQNSAGKKSDIKIIGQINEFVDFKYNYQNFNILQEYLQLLIVFKTWKSFSKKLFQKSQRGMYEYTEQTSQEEGGSAISPAKSPERVELPKAEKLYASQAIDEPNKEEIIKTFQESNKYKLTNQFTNNSSTQGIIYEPAGIMQKQRQPSFYISDLIQMQNEHN